MNRVQIKLLRWANMFNYAGEEEMNFDSTVTQLNGINGSGKSAIPAILEDLLYNKNSRGVKKASIKNRYTDDNKYYSEIFFSIGDDEYHLRKDVASTTKLKLECNGKDISGHTATQTYTVIQELIGLDFATFSKLVYQSVNSSLDFLKATDANRKKFLISLMGLEGYTEVGQAIKTVLTNEKTELSNNQSSIKSLSGYVVEVPEAKEKVKVPEPYTPEFSISEARDELYGLQKQSVVISHNNKAIDKLNSLRLPEEPTKPEDFDSAYMDTYKEVSREVAAEESELKTLKKPATKCPTCGTPYNNDDQVEHIEARVKELKESIELKSKKLKELASVISRMNKYETDKKLYLAKIEERQRLEDEVDQSLPTEVPDIDSQKRRIDEEEKKVQNRQAEISKAEKHNSEIESHNSKIEAQREQVQKVKADIAKHEVKVRNLEKSVAKLEVLTQAFGTKGLISYKIESMIKVFEELINEYLGVLANGRFNLVFKVEDTKLALNLYDSGQEIEINSLSSGEFNRVNTATLLAIRKLMTAISKVDINVLFLDEVVSVLDKEGKDTLVEVLLNEDLNSVVVSHGYNHPLARTIHIEVDEEGVSRLKDGE